MNLLQITAKAQPYSKTDDRGLVAPHASVHLRIHVDGNELGCSHSINGEPVLDGLLLLATREFGGEHFLLTCTCGVPECARIDDPVLVRRSNTEVEWTFPASYAEYLTAHGFGDLRFVFDRAAYDATLRRIHEFVEATEPLLALPACIGEPVSYHGDDYSTQAARLRKWLPSLNDGSDGA
ncbi:hypothetical protein [Burkholderia cenocepacia]|uniref:hypothetical protein n=1 Tax=Burkholderia cenocepacia TaxID=95486 RepID=UPI0007613A9F|nr:hypothetical protein [Burkholderia cenocepacia]KWU19110.1 hypothetical protein AS149_12750 [Burkholderia cenocepacia]